MVMVSSDTALAHHLARREQEQEDAEFAKKLSEDTRMEDDAALARRLAASAAGIDPGLGGLEEDWRDASNIKALYVPCEIGAHEVEILVDTGAEMSIISESLARQLDLLHRLDKRYRGTARGVGSAAILGKVFDVPVKLGQVEFELTFSVLQTQNCELILGLDLMRYFKCLVDLEKNCLIFGGSGGVEVPFLASSRKEVLSAALVRGHRAAELLRTRVDPLAARLSLETLGKVLRNIATWPMEPKYRRLRGSNPRLQQHLLAHPEAVEILRVAGFILQGDDLVLPERAPLDALKQLTGASFLPTR